MSHIRPDQRRRGRLRLLVVLLGAALGILSAIGVAAAVWSITSNAGSQGSAAAATLRSPTYPTATVGGSGAITIGWTVPGAQLTGAQYRVTRTSGPGSPTTVCTVTSSTTSCQDTGLSAATAYSYGVAAVLSSWTSSPATVSATTATPTLAIALASGPYTAGTATSVVSIVAKVGGLTDPTYAGTRTLTWSGLATSGSGNAPSYPTTSATFVAGSATLNSALTAYASGAQTLSVAESGNALVTGSAALTVNAAAAGRIAFTSSAVSGVAAGSATLGPLTVQQQDGYGNAVPAGTGGLSIGIGSSSSGTVVFATSSGGNATSTVTIPAGSSSVSFYYGDTRAGTPTITASSTGLTSATQAQTVTAASASKLVITSAAVSGSASGSASLGPITVAQQDAYGNAVNAVSGGLSVNLSSSSTGTTGFATTSGGPSITAVTIPAGSSSVTFYYGDTKSGSPVVTAAQTGLASANQTETITSATAAKLAITSTAMSSSASGSATLGPIRVQLQDAFGNPVNAAGGGAAVTLSSSSSGTAVFSATSGGTATTSVTIPNGASSASFYYGDTRAGSPVVAASRSGLTAATQTETITAAAASKVVFTAAPSTGSHGSSATIGPFTVQLQDQWGNPVTAGSSGVSVSLSSTGNGFFTTTSGGNTRVSSVTITSGASSVSFYYGDQNKETNTLTAAVTGLASATTSVTTN